MKAMANAGVMLGCRVLADSLNVVLFITISRVFGPQGVGVYSYGFAVAGFVWAATVLGVDEYGLREYQRAAAVQRRSLIADLLGLQLGVGCLAFGSVALYLWVTKPTASIAFIVSALALYQFLNALAATLFVPAMAEQRMMRPALIALIARSLAFGVASVLLFTGAVSLALSLAIFPVAGLFYVVNAAISARVHLNGLGVHFSAAAMRRAIGEMWSFATVEILGQVLARISIVVLTLRLGEQAAGVYATGLKLIEVAFLPLWFLTLAAYPALCRSFMNDTAAFVRQGHQLLWVTLALSVLVALGMYLVVPLILVPVLGPSYAGTQELIAAMALIALMYGPEIGLGRYLFASHLHTVRAAIIAAGALLCVVANLVLVGKLAVWGAVYATALAYFVVNALYLFHLRKPIAGRLLSSPAVSP
jgi:O-antigen/teichoic acid export membrane protein